MIATGNARRAQPGKWLSLHQTPKKNIVMRKADLLSPFKCVSSFGIMFFESEGEKWK